MTYKEDMKFQKHNIKAIQFEINEAQNDFKIFFLKVSLKLGRFRLPIIDILFSCVSANFQQPV